MHFTTCVHKLRLRTAGVRVDESADESSEHIVFEKGHLFRKGQRSHITLQGHDAETICDDAHIVDSQKLSASLHAVLQS